jgi:NAD(P)H-flavin reductase
MIIQCLVVLFLGKGKNEEKKQINGRVLLDSDYLELKSGPPIQVRETKGSWTMRSLSAFLLISVVVNVHSWYSSSKISRNKVNIPPQSGLISREFRGLQSATALKVAPVSLDQPLLSRSLPFGNRFGLLVYISIYAILRCIYIVAPETNGLALFGDKLIDGADQIRNVLTPLMTRLASFSSYFKGDLFPFLRLCGRIASAKASLWKENLTEALGKVTGLSASDLIDLKEWGVCTLSEREALPGGYFRYRFDIEFDDATVPVEIGQEILLCSVDTNDHVLKETFFLTSSKNSRGYFDIVTRRGGDSSSDHFAAALSMLALGDEVAYKAGRYRLNYEGSDDPIKSFSICASHLGGSTALHLLQNLLPRGSTTVDDVELLWVNEDPEDFYCNEQIEKLEYRYIEKLIVTRVIEDDLYGRDVTKSEEARSALHPYEDGALAVICAPDYVATKARSLYLELGYPAQNIITILCPST